MNHQENPTQQQWVIGGLVALLGIGVYFAVRKKPATKTSSADSGQLGPPPQADASAPGAPVYVTFTPTTQPSLPVFNLTYTAPNYCFPTNAIQFYPFTWTMPNHDFGYYNSSPTSWGPPTAEQKPGRYVRYSSVTCKFYMWGVGQWVENKMIQDAANAWAKSKGYM